MNQILLLLLVASVTVVKADDCQDMDKCWYQVASQCPPSVSVVDSSQKWCSDRLAACYGYVRVCNAAGANITIDLSKSVPLPTTCGDILTKCTKAISGLCPMRGLGTPIATATGGNTCPMEAICIGDARFCFCDEVNANCSTSLAFTSNGTSLGENVFRMFAVSLMVAIIVNVWFM